MLTLPPEFVGLWQRVDLLVDGEAMAAGRSYWFQSEEQFFDFRAGSEGIQSEAFAGTTAWDEASRTLTWTHLLDMHDITGEDVGRIEWDGDDLIEHGTAEVLGETIEYTERWRRRDDGCGVALAERLGGSGRIAFGGTHCAVAIDAEPGRPIRGGLARDRGWAWVFDLVMGSSLGLAHGTAPTEPGAEFDRYGERWRVL